jgi:hypothetical protein
MEADAAFARSIGAAAATRELTETAARWPEADHSRLLATLGACAREGDMVLASLL